MDAERLNKLFAVVLFPPQNDDDDDGEEFVSAVCQAWIEQPNSCYWPVNAPSVRKLIESCVAPKSSPFTWKLYENVSILKQDIDSYQRAVNGERAALEKDCLNTDDLSNSPLVPLKRQRKNIIRYTPSPFKEDSTSGDLDQQTPPECRRSPRLLQRHIQNNIPSKDTVKRKISFASSKPTSGRQSKTTTKSKKFLENIEQSEEYMIEKFPTPPRTTVQKPNVTSAESLLDTPYDVQNRVSVEEPYEVEDGGSVEELYEVQNASSVGVSSEVRKVSGVKGPSEVHEVSGVKAPSKVQEVGNDLVQRQPGTSTSQEFHTIFNRKYPDFSNWWCNAEAGEQIFFIGVSLYELRTKGVLVSRNSRLPDNSTQNDELEVDVDLTIFPINSKDALERAENKTDEKTFKAKLVHVYKKKKGMDYGDTIRKMCKFTFTDEFAQSYSLKGIGKKENFSKLKLVQIITQTVDVLYNDKKKQLIKVTDEEIATKLNLWLSHAPTRIKKAREAASKKKQKDKQKSTISIDDVLQDADAA